MNPNDEPDFENLTTAEAESCMKASNREMNIHLIVQRSEEIGSSGDLMLLATHVLEALPADVLEDLEKKHTCIFAQPSDFMGRALHRSFSGWLVYLSPELKDHSPAYIRYVIAHELAHIRLGHEETFYKEGEAGEAAARDEQAADDLASDWEFPRPPDYPAHRRSPMKARRRRVENRLLMVNGEPPPGPPG